jgi:TolB-like protein/DNA-binding winged helix-turn-helix (wHTH) protein
MELASQHHRVVRFGVFEADLVARELRKNGVKVHLQEQPFLFLEALVERPGEVVTREELRQRLWPGDTFVDFDNSLNTAMNKIREALGDSAEHPIFVQTLPRRGYRFIAPIDANENGQKAKDQTQPETVEIAPKVMRYRAMLIGGLAILGAAIILFGALVGLDVDGLRGRMWGRTATPRIRSLAVLPLANLSNDPAQEYFTDGMTDALITELSQISALKVISRTSMMQYKKTDKSLPQIARELDVDAVVEGTVQRSGDRVRISAQLIQGATDKHIWASSYDRSMQDVLSLQGDIANEIAEEIRVKVTPQERQRMTHARPINLNAVEDYLQGRYHYQKAKDVGFHRGAEKAHEAELNHAVAFFQQAVAEDPYYAQAYLGIGEIWGVPATYPYPPTSMAQPAREALKKALAIDPDLAEAYVDLGRIDYRYWNWSALEFEAKHAIELNPNLASAHDLYAAYLLVMGRIDEAMEEAERTRALDPGTDRVAWVFYCRHQFDRFIEMKRSDVERHAFGAMGHYDLGHGYEHAHMYKEAVEEWEEAMSGFGYEDLAEDLRQGYGVGGFEGAVRGWAAGLETLSMQGEPIHPDLMVYLYAILGERDRSFAWLEKSMEMHSSGSSVLTIDPDMDELRSDPRFADLLRRVGLSP